MKMIVIKTRPEMDCDEVRWEDDNGHSVGFGYINKEDGNFGLIKCPECGKENYAMNVASGRCTWCPFTLVEKPLQKGGTETQV